MSTLTTFDSTKEALQDVLRSIGQGKTQLPDFQREWVWDDEHVRSLLASISLAYPIGAVMMLQTGGESIKFKPRLVEGVGIDQLPPPERLIMDGQQRLTSLYQALMSGKPVQTRDIRKASIKRWYYLQIDKALSSSDRDEAVVGLPEDRKVRNFRGEVTADYSTLDKECAAGMLPLHLIFDVGGLTGWQMRYLQMDAANLSQRMERWNQLVLSVVQQLQQYQVPLIILRKETPKVGVCQVFEKVNTGGVPLTVFELLTATFAAEDFNLRKDWEERRKRLAKYPVLAKLESSDFLQAVSLLATFTKRKAAVSAGNKAADAPGISCKREQILKLDLVDYKQWADQATTGFERAAKFLHGQKVFAARDLPYRTQITPLAAILTTLDYKAENDGAKQMIARWYWSGVFGELYGSAIETRFAKDLPEVVTWVEGGAEPSTVTEANFVAKRLLTLRTRNSAAYKGLYALLLRDGGLDFRTGDPVEAQMYFDDKIDIHHIFPEIWCCNNGKDRKLYDCIVNKAPLSARTNRMIGGHAPSLYLPRLQKNAGIDTVRMDSILSSHVVDAAALRTDDFEGFFKARESALLQRIERALGKPVATGVDLPIEEIEAGGQDADIDSAEEEDLTENVAPSNRRARNELTPTQTLYLEFFTGLKEFCHSQGAGLTLREPAPQHWLTCGIGRTGFLISLTASTTKRRVGCEIYIQGPRAKSAFKLLELDKSAIEQVTGPLQWMELPEGQDSRILLVHEQVNVRDKATWETTYRWLKDKGELFHMTFSPRIRDLNLI